MDWTELNITIPAQRVDEAAAIAQMVVPYGIYIEDYSDLLTEAPKIAHIDLIDEDLLKKDPTKAIIHLYISPEENPAEAVSFLRERLDAAGIEYSIGSENVRELDWATAWKEYYHPIKLGRRLVVCPSWEEYDSSPEDLVITLDPGMAFGTGTHDTTRLCLQLLEDYACPGKEMLDVGSGSGILAISAAKLGCDHCVGVEIDEMAVRTARENIAVNHVEDRVKMICGDLVTEVTGKYQVICANIVADVILRLLPAMMPFLDEDGVFIASGIIDSREEDVLAGLEQYGLKLEQRKTSGGWVALACKRG